jgi:hypothetical protein
MKFILIALALTLVCSYESLDDIEMRKFFEKVLIKVFIMNRSHNKNLVKQ